MVIKRFEIVFKEFGDSQRYTYEKILKLLTIGK